MNMRTIYSTALLLSLAACSSAPMEQEPGGSAPACTASNATELTLNVVVASFPGREVKGWSHKDGLVDVKDTVMVVDGVCIVDGVERYEYHGHLNCTPGGLEVVSVTLQVPEPESIATGYVAPCTREMAKMHGLEVLSTYIQPERGAVLPDTASIYLTWDEVACFTLSGQFLERDGTTEFIVSLCCTSEGWSHSVIAIDGMSVRPGQLY